jgi:hypothetical protein
MPTGAFPQPIIGRTGVNFQETKSRKIVKADIIVQSFRLGWNIAESKPGLDYCCRPQTLDMKLFDVVRLFSKLQKTSSDWSIGHILC